MNQALLARLVILSTVIVAVTRPAIYTWPIRTIGMEGWLEPVAIAGSLMAVLFIASPILAAVLFLMGKRVCFIWLGLFGFAAFTFGVTPIPLVQYLYTENVALNSVFIGAANLGLVLLAAYLYIVSKSLKRDAASGAA